MRIEEIRFCNLNSLAGEWVVDFTHPDYVGEGLFAITGPTGAGKSTILDAVCLALYGRTPRLGGISATCNEIMSRQTGYCRAEVTFATLRGRYRCSWHQKRARNRPDGALQPIERRFVKADTGEVLEERIKKVNEAVEASTGMDFDRFTRSVMLAQGGFAHFLFAAPEQRSRILESLTGTTIYRDISKHVYARCAHETRTLDTLNSRLGGIALLSQEEVGRLGADLESKRQQQVVSRAELVNVEKGLHWLRGLEALRAELARLEVQKRTLLEQHATFEPQRRVLRRAEKAQTLRPDFIELSLVGKAQTEAQQQVTQGRAAVPALEQRVGLAEQHHTTAANGADSTRKDHEAALPSLREAGKLDVQLAEKDARLQTENTNLADAEKARTLLQRAYDAHRKQGEAVRGELADLHQQMHTHAADAALVESLAGLEERFVHVWRLHTQLQTGRDAAKKAHESGELATKSLAAQGIAVEAVQQAEAEARAQLDAQQATILAQLQGRELAAWREELTRLLEAKNQLLAAQDLCARRADATAKLLETQAVAKTVATRQQACTATISAHNVRLKAQLAEQEILEKDADRFRTMSSLAEHRTHLQDGSECPLCGALHHPFAEDTPASAGVSERLTPVRAACEQARQELEALHIQQAEDAKVLQENAARQTERSALMAELDSRLAQLSCSLAMAASPLEMQKDLAARLAATEASLAAVNALLGRVEADEKALPGLRNALHAAAAKTVTAQLAHASSTQALAASHRDCTRLAAENTALAASLQTLLCTLEAEVLPFGEEAVTLELLESVRNRLRTRRERWQGFVARNVALQQQAAALDAQLAQETVRLTGEARQIQTRSELVQALATGRQALAEQRLRCFAGGDPLKEEALLASRMVEAEKQRKVAETALIDARQALAAHQAELARLRTGMDERATQLQTLQAAFTSRLHEAGFVDQTGVVDQADFVAACLPESDSLRLSTEERRLDDALTGLAANLTRLTAQFAEQQATPLTTVTLPELEDAQTRLQDCIARVHSELGACEQALKTDASARIRHAALLETIAQQQAVTTRWVELNRLIGSSEGQTYSRFAQGITFEIMLDHANRQLQAMKDRYLLVRDTAEPLTLNVIDSFQAGEVRPTTNLSGGESFLVSLALALGLSRMASQNVRVDSLFLDEGFGSLDDDALETALSTISSLREEGKLIGLISHVPAIKERVSTQIVVTPVAGGKSQLQGPGVTGI